MPYRRGRPRAPPARFCFRQRLLQTLAESTSTPSKSKPLREISDSFGACSAYTCLQGGIYQWLRTAYRHCVNKPGAADCSVASLAPPPSDTTHRPGYGRPLRRLIGRGLNCGSDSTCTAPGEAGRPGSPRCGSRFHAFLAPPTHLAVRNFAGARGINAVVLATDGVAAAVRPRELSRP
jgi:hypothetical protein